MADRRLPSRVLAGLSGLPRAFIDTKDAEGERDDGPPPVELAFERGRSEGIEAGAARAAEELGAQCAALREAISETVRSMVGLRKRTTRQHQRQMFELALTAASRMLREKIDEDDPVAARALQEALAALPECGAVRARLHPEDIESVRRDLAAEIETGSVVLTADDAIRRGGCIVNSDVGTIDATVETATATVLEAATGTGPP